MASYTLTGDALVGVVPDDAVKTFAQLPQEVFMGRRRPRARPPALPLKRYLNRSRGRIPTEPIDYYTKAMEAIRRMYLNDQLGCCVIASAYHQVGVWSAAVTGTPLMGTDQEVLKTYRIWNPGNQDGGCDIGQVLNYTRDHGVPVGGVLHKIDGYVAVDWRDWEEVLVALYLFASLKLGINLPQAWLNNSIWDTTNTQIVGGHDVPCVGSILGPNKIRIASWAKCYDITQPAFTSTKYLEECYAALSPDWYDKAKNSPVNIDADQLKHDLDILNSGGLPPIDPAMKPWESILP
jgi:hypothetical protein